ncbi:thioredoxin [Candidatus Obscuribacterales bacterium]|nr:thioredoxin [Candidatus Obscuribacterales bacterium]
MKSLKVLATLCASAAVVVAAIALSPAVSTAQTIQGQVQAVEKVEIKELDTNTFDTELQNSTIPVLVDFTAAWCGPCQQLKPKLEALAQEFKGKVLFTKVEHTHNPSLVMKNGIRAFPTVKIYAPGGKEMSISVGNVSLNDLRKWIQEQVDANDKAQSAQPQIQKP